MVGFLNRFKLRNQLAMLVTIAVVMMVGVQLFYYIWFYFLIQDRTRVYVDNIIEQVQDNLTITSTNMAELAATVSYDRFVQDYLTEENVIRKKALIDTISNYINYISASNKGIHNICLVDNQGRTFSLYSTNDYSIISDLAKRYDSRSSRFVTPVFSPIIPESPNSNTYYYAYLTPVFSVASQSDPNTKIGTCIILHKVDDLQHMIEKISISQDALFLIEDSENKIVAANDRKLNGKYFDETVYGDDFWGKEKTERYFNNKKTIIQHRIIHNLNFRIVSVIPVKEMTRDMIPIRNTGLLIGVAMVLMLIFIGLLFSRNITSPIGKIIHFLESIGENYLHQRLYMKEMNEIGQLTLYINKMLGNIEDINRRIVNTQSSLYEMELAKKQAELSSLQNQINPHFLYNTLNCIQSIGLVAGSMDIVNISSALIKIFRYSIKGEHYVSIKREIECITDYLSIMSIRYQGKFITQIDVEDSILEIKTIKMILQPIVENAVYHGLECKKGQGHLTIQGYLKDEDNICFEVSDDGIGIPESELQKIQYYLNREVSYDDLNKAGTVALGLININNRIKLSYGKKYGIQISSRENEGTKVVLHIPRGIPEDISNR